MSCTTTNGSQKSVLNSMTPYCMRSGDIHIPTPSTSYVVPSIVFLSHSRSPVHSYWKTLFLELSRSNVVSEPGIIIKKKISPFEKFKFYHQSSFAFCSSTNNVFSWIVSYRLWTLTLTDRQLLTSRKSRWTVMDIGIRGCACTTWTHCLLPF